MENNPEIDGPRAHHKKAREVLEHLGWSEPTEAEVELVAGELYSAVLVERNRCCDILIEHDECNVMHLIEAP